jgi:hypothetical protein
MSLQSPHHPDPFLQHQALVSLPAIEAKRVADLATPWQAQLALTNTALTTANNSRISLSSLNTIKGLYRHIKRHISFLQHSYCRRFRGKTTVAINNST